MEGWSRADLDRAEKKDFAIGDGPKRPRDAATLIVVDRAGGRNLVLMGRRHRRHVFMPGKFVFPGGRTDPADGRIPVAAALHPSEAGRLAGTGARATQARARAIAMSAIRETYEEAGLLIGTRSEFQTGSADWRGFADAGVCPSLEALRFVARAITPPGRVRRYDTRFLATWRENVAVELDDGGPTDELEELVWLPLAEAIEADVPTITRAVLEDLRARLDADPSLTPGMPVPFYRMRGNSFARDLI